MIPFIKKQIFGTGVFRFFRLDCFGEETIVRFAVEYLSEFFSPVCTAQDEKSANVLLVCDESLQNGAYGLEIKYKCVVYYGDKEGVRNALATLLQGVCIQEGRYVLPCQSVQDYPDCTYRSVMIDLARGLPEQVRLKEDVKRLSLAKCNKLHLHLMDALGVCYDSSVFKGQGEIRGTKLYSKADLKGLVAYCEKLGIEVIPEIEFPAHATTLTQTYPHLKCQTDVEKPSGWTVCLGNEKTYEFFEELTGEICEIFPCEYIHIGGDEHAFEDLPTQNRRYHWKDCKVCRVKMEAEKLIDERELFYYGVRRMRDIAKKAGRKIILWNDELDVSKSVDIPKDCTVQFWRIANRYRGPREGCSFEKLLQAGYDVICSPFEYCYIDLEEYANPEKLASFDYKSYENDGKYANKILGCEACAWEYGNPEYSHYTYSFTPSAILLLAKTWDRRNVTYEKAYRRELSKLILGCFTPTDYDMFELFGSIMPPRINGQNSYATVQNELIDKETLTRHKQILSDIPHTYSPFYVQAIQRLLEGI